MVYWATENFQKFQGSVRSEEVPSGVHVFSRRQKDKLDEFR